MIQHSRSLSASAPTLLLACVTTLVAPMLFAQSATSDENVGFVLELSGRWQMNVGDRSRPVEKGQAIPVGARLLSPAPPARLTIVTLDGDHVTCPADPRCAAPMQRRHTQPGTISRLVGAVSGLFSRPERYVTTMSRGEDLAEAVIALEGHEISIADTFRTMPAGRYTISLVRLSEGPDSGNGSSVSVQWNPQAPSPLHLAGTETGLYRLILESEADAWVLVVNTDRYADAKARFDEAHALASEWKDVPPDAIRSFLRAALEVIAEESSAE